MFDEEESGVTVTAVPEWVDHASYENGGAASDAMVSGGLCALLKDTQIKLEESGSCCSRRVVMRIMTQEGAERAAQFTSTFDPANQRVELHRARVIRGDVIFDHADGQRIEVMRRERELERRVLNGHLTASLIVPDVRTDDIVEFCWTVFGGHQLLQNCFGDWWALEGAEPIQALHFRLCAPASRRIAIRYFGEAPEEQTIDTGSMIDRRWQVKQTRRQQTEALTPAWRALPRSIQMSEAGSWSDVVELFAPGYSVETHLPQAIRDEATRIAEQSPEGSKARVLAVLRAVQNRLRYLALSLGEGGLIPRPVGEVWDKGYGDCKDAARCFVTLATLTNIDAVPALVATQIGPALDTVLPSPTVFDHCIVRVRLGEETFWIDPVRRTLGTSLAEASRTYFGWALPISESTAALEETCLPPPSLMLDSRELVSFGPNVSSPATLELQLDYFSLLADQMHKLLSGEGLEAVSKRFLRRYQQTWPSITQKTPLSVEESPERSRLGIRGSYEIGAPWGKPSNDRVSFSISDLGIANELARLPPGETRKNEIFLGVPRTLRRRVELNMPKAWPGSSSFDTEETAGLKYKKSIVIYGGAKVVQEQELVVSALSLPPSAAGDYDRVTQHLRDQSTLIASSQVKGDKFVIIEKSKGSGTDLRIALFIGGLLLMLLSLFAQGQH